MLNVHFTAGDGKGWALDEDLRQIKASIGSMVRSSGPAAADVVHAAYWGNLLQVAPAILRDRFVIAHADNPPFYSLKQVEFGLGSQWVDLWVARSTEAHGQFSKLGLPVVHIPYSIDPKLFFPILDKRALRIKHGLPPDAYLIANFHRDAEGSDLHTPKFQKAPELFVIILKALMELGHPVHALLAGPRRHWMRRQLREHGIPFTFIGKDTGERDDFGTNILDRPTLNELTNAADLYLIPSRWEGGPQSVMEAAACRIPVISTPLGVSRDILEPQCLFQSVREAVDCIASDIRNRTLKDTVETHFNRWQANHTTGRMAEELRLLYEKLPERMQTRPEKAHRFKAHAQSLAFRLLNRWDPPAPARSLRIVHQQGLIASMDRLMEKLTLHLQEMGFRADSDHPDLILTGVPKKQNQSGTRRIPTIQWITPDLPPNHILPDSLIVTPSVQDVLELKQHGVPNPSIVLPLLDSHLPSSGQPDPLLIATGDTKASLRIWDALSHGIPVAYPSDSAYGEQVFLGGLPYASLEHSDEVLKQLWTEASTFQQLIRIPNQEETSAMLYRLLRLGSLARYPSLVFP